MCLKFHFVEWLLQGRDRWIIDKYLHCTSKIFRMPREFKCGTHKSYVYFVYRRWPSILIPIFSSIMNSLKFCFLNFLSISTSIPYFQDLLPTYAIIWGLSIGDKNFFFCHMKTTFDFHCTLLSRFIFFEILMYTNRNSNEYRLTSFDCM